MMSLERNKGIKMTQDNTPNPNPNSNPNKGLKWLKITHGLAGAGLSLQRTVAKLIQVNRSLRSLDLRHLPLDDSIIGAALSVSNSSLETLDLSSAPWLQPQTESMSLYLSKNRSIKHLSLTLPTQDVDGNITELIQVSTLPHQNTPHSLTQILTLNPNPFMCRLSLSTVPSKCSQSQGLSTHSHPPSNSRLVSNE